MYKASADEWKEVEKIPTINGSTLEIKEEKEYQWYRIKKEGGYFKEAPSEDFKKTEFSIVTSTWSDWQNEYPNGKEFVEAKTVYHYQQMKKIKYIRISEKNNSNFTFAAIQLYKGRKQIQYQKEETENEIILELKEPCYFDELEVEMTLINTNKEENAFLMEWLYELNLPSCMKAYTRQWFNVSTTAIFTERKMTSNKSLYEEEHISLERVEENAHTKVYTSEQYRYQERLFYYEKETKEYSKEFSSVMIEGYPYPDFDTERTRLFCRFHKKPDEIKEVYVTKEVPVEKIVLKEVPVEKIVFKEASNSSLLKQDNIFLKQEVENLKFRIASLSNEKSEVLEKNETLEKNVKQEKVSLKKQSLEASFSIVMFVLGYLLGRIVTMKKKF